MIVSNVTASKSTGGSTSTSTTRDARSVTVRVSLALVYHCQLAVPRTTRRIHVTTSVMYPGFTAAPL
eukprot:3185240-Rhodomonas_salina.1